MVSSVSNISNTGIGQATGGFLNSTDMNNFVVSLQEESSPLKILGEDNLRTIVKLQLRSLAKNPKNEHVNPETYSFIDKILEKASGEDLENFFHNYACDEGSELSHLNTTDKLIKDVGMEKDPQYEQFMSKITQNAIERLIDQMSVESDLEKLQESSKEFEALLDSMKKYNENYRCNLALRYEI